MEKYLNTIKPWLFHGTLCQHHLLTTRTRLTAFNYKSSLVEKIPDKISSLSSTSQPQKALVLYVAQPHHAMLLS